MRLFVGLRVFLSRWFSPCQQGRLFLVCLSVCPFVLQLLFSHVVYMLRCMNACVRVCMHVDVYECMCTCVYACVRVCVHVDVYVNVRVAF